MFVVSLMLKSGGSPVSLSFETLERAEKFYNMLDGGVTEISIRDDYGVRVILKAEEIAVASFLDTDKEFERQATMQLAQARAQLKFQRSAANDPVIKLLQTPGINQ